MRTTGKLIVLMGSVQVAAKVKEQLRGWFGETVDKVTCMHTPDVYGSLEHDILALHFAFPVAPSKYTYALCAQDDMYDTEF